MCGSDPGLDRPCSALLCSALPCPALSCAVLPCPGCLAAWLPGCLPVLPWNISALNISTQKCWLIVLFCFVLISLQLLVCLWWHDYRRDDFPTLSFVVVIADLLAIC